MNIGVDPVAFAIGSLEIRWYGIMVAVAVMVGVWIPLRLARRWGGIELSQSQLMGVAVWGVIGGIIGARLIHVFDEWSYFVEHPGEIIGGEGLGIFGAILGGTLFGVIYAKTKGFPVGRLCDVAAYGLISAQAIGRIGCILNGCCYGTPTGLPWGTAWTDPDSDGFAATAMIGGKVHPTQLYELLWDVLVLALIWKLRHRVKRAGAIYLIYVSIYSIGRFTISFWRENEEAFLGLQQAQVVSLGVLIIALGLLARLYRKRSPDGGGISLRGGV